MPTWVENTAVPSTLRAVILGFPHTVKLWLFFAVRCLADTAPAAWDHLAEYLMKSLQALGPCTLCL